MIEARLRASGALISSIIPDAGHGFLLQAAEMANEAILSFLRRQKKEA